MRHDPGWALVAALEIFDEDTGTATKAPIFSTDLLTAEIQRNTADTPEEALAMCLDRTQRVDMDLIASLLGVSVEDTGDLLAGLVYPSLEDPDELVPTFPRPPKAPQSITAPTRELSTTATTTRLGGPSHRPPR